MFTQTKNAFKHVAFKCRFVVIQYVIACFFSCSAVTNLVAYFFVYIHIRTMQMLLGIQKTVSAVNKNESKYLVFTGISVILIFLVSPTFISNIYFISHWFDFSSYISLHHPWHSCRLKKKLFRSRISSHSKNIRFCCCCCWPHLASLSVKLMRFEGRMKGAVF